MIFPVLGMALMLVFSACEQTGSGASSELDQFENADALVDAAKVNVEAIDINTYKKMVDEMEEYFVLIDVRTESEFANGYIPGAVSIPRGALEFRIASESVWDNEGLYIPLKEDQLIVYCKKGSRSVLAAETLKKLGYTNVKYLEGGWIEWHDTYPERMEKLVVEGSALSGMSSSDDGGGGC